MLQPLPPSYPMPPLNTNPLTSACSLHADLFNCLCLSQCLSIVVCGVANLYLTIFCIRHCLCFCRSLHVVLFFSFALQSEFLFFRCFYVCLCHCHFFSQCTVLYLHLHIPICFSLPLSMSQLSFCFFLLLCLYLCLCIFYLLLYHCAFVSISCSVSLSYSTSFFYLFYVSALYYFLLHNLYPLLL